MIINPANRVSEVKAYYFATKLQEIAQMKASGKDVINLGIGSPDLLPDSKVIAQLYQSSNAPEANKYQSYKGISTLRQAIVQWYDLNYGVKLNADNEVLPLMGSKEGLMHIAMSFLGEGDIALVPNPGYPAYRTVTQLAGATSVDYKLTADNDWQPNMAALSDVDIDRVKLMWVNYPHMPTGANMNLEVMKSLIDWAKEHKVLLVHDNPYSHILNDSPTSILSIAGAMEVCIELNSLSKSHNMAGWRVGMLLADSEYVDTVMRFKSNMDSGMYRPIQEAAAAALRLDQTWTEQLNMEYRQRRQIVWSIMEALNCSYDPDAVGMFVWGKVPQGTGEKLVDHLLYDKNVFVTPGFIFGSEGNEYIRISLCVDRATLRNALQRIKS